LLRELMMRGWQTAYQANQLAQARGGALLLGRFIVLDKLGKGGMGHTSGARPQSGTRRAIKVLRGDSQVRLWQLPQ
jgi:hypothetical protein